ncbi:hypothetical protein GCM10020220_115300 [Nonomuraea rubra]
MSGRQATARDLYENVDTCSAVATSSQEVLRKLPPRALCGAKPIEWDDAVEAVDVLADAGGEGVEVLVVLDVELQDRRRGGQALGDALHQAEAAEAGQDDGGALLLGQLGHRESDGGVRQDTGHEDPLAFENAHVSAPFRVRRRRGSRPR